MLWKNILLILLALITVISILYTYIKCSSNPALQTIVIHDGVDLSGLHDNIKKVYIVLSRINKFVDPMPITHEFSHWMVLFETETNKHYLR